MDSTATPQKDLSSSDGSAELRAYVKPQLRVLGEARECTLGTYGEGTESFAYVS
jgi:hypothetical protein